MILFIFFHTQLKLSKFSFTSTIQPEFDNPIIITSKYEESGRFGTALGKIGDINNDGLNDFAISAPFENDGVVYIYLGCKKCRTYEFSQRLEVEDSKMFGFSISSGIDIDKNNFQDFAVGSPGSDTVHMFQTYRIINVHVTIKEKNNVTNIETGRLLSFQVCAKISFSDDKRPDPELFTGENLEFIQLIFLIII